MEALESILHSRQILPMQAAFTALCADAQAKTRKAEEIFGTDIERCGHDILVFLINEGTLKPMGTPTPTKMGDLYDGIYILCNIYIYS